MSQGTERGQYTVFDIWGRIGITEHMGGVKATERLIDLCRIRPRQRVLLLGCGTGYTACLLAKRSVDVVAVDIEMTVLDWASKRIAEEGVSAKVTLVAGDIQHLPFARESFDVAMAESVLIFTDPEQTSVGVSAILKPGGYFGINELTCLHPPPELLSRVFARAAVGATVRLQSERQWLDVFKKAGLLQVSSSVSRISLWEQLASHIQVDGWQHYLAGSMQALLDPKISSIYFSRDVLSVLLQLPSLLKYLGYGLYVGVKRGEDQA